MTLSIFFFNDTSTTEIYTLSLHDALPISPGRVEASPADPAGVWPLRPRPEVVRGFDPPDVRWGSGHRGVDLAGDVDRKSTRLNSSHAHISYAVFCLKKKTAWPRAWAGIRR